MWEQRMCIPLTIKILAKSSPISQWSMPELKISPFLPILGDSDPCLRPISWKRCNWTPNSHQNDCERTQFASYYDVRDKGRQKNYAEIMRKNAELCGIMRNYAENAELCGIMRNYADRIICPPLLILWSTRQKANIFYLTLWCPSTTTKENGNPFVGWPQLRLFLFRMATL